MTLPYLTGAQPERREVLVGATWLVLSNVMTMRALSLTSDRTAVAAFFAGAADYVQLETGQPPTASTADDFFNERPPQVAAKDALHFGVFDAGKMVGIITVSFGYPDSSDCYIGLLLLSPDARGMGFGRRALDYATQVARKRGATRQLVAVLDANPKGRAFWEREGFVLEKTFAPTDDGHTRHRLIRAI